MGKVNHRACDFPALRSGTFLSLDNGCRCDTFSSNLIHLATIIPQIHPLISGTRSVKTLQPMETPQWRGAIAGGVWQSVRLTATNDLYVKDVFTEPLAQSAQPTGKNVLLPFFDQLAAFTAVPYASTSTPVTPFP
jgi:hypothetical protein